MKNAKIKVQPLSLSFYPILLEVPQIPSHASAQVFHGFIGSTPFQLVSMSVVGSDAIPGVQQFEAFLDTVRTSMSALVGDSMTSTESVFDTILIHINTHWQEQVDKKYHYTFKTGTLILALFLEGHMCIADRGQASAFIIPCSGLTVSNEGITPIIDGIGGTLPHSTVLFESVVCGVLFPHSRLIIGNRSMKILGRTDDIAHLLQKSTTTPQDIGARIIKKIGGSLSEAAAIMIIDSTKAEQPPQSSSEAKKEAAVQALEARSFIKKVTQGVLLVSLFIGTHISIPFKRIAKFLTEYLKALPRNKKIVLLSILSIFFLLLGSLGVTAWHSRIKNSTSTINTLTHTLENQKNHLETIIPFGDGPQIQKALTEINTTLITMRALGTNGTHSAEALEPTIQPLLDRIQLKKSVTLSHERDFPASESAWQLASTVDGFTAVNQQLHTLVKGEKTIIIPADIQSIKPESTNTAVMLKDGRIALIAKDGTITLSSLSASQSQKSIITALPYAGFLYTVLSDGSIYKYRGSTAGYTRPALWNTEKTLTDSVDSAIDGAVYVLNKTSVTKLFKGKPESFTPTIVPALTNPTSIITFPEFEKVYICEGSAHRILVLSKNGVLIAGLDTNDPFDSCAINEKLKKGYVTRGNALYSFVIP